ncbi:MAG: phytase [Bacteroidota bacterium]
MKQDRFLLKYFVWIISLIPFACTLPNEPEIPDVYAAVETDPVQAAEGDDSADDPAIWVNRYDPTKSLVYGSNKRFGIEVFDLAGKKRYTYEVGYVNNIDILYEFPLNDSTTVDLLAGTEQSKNQILVFTINSDNGSLTEISGGIKSVQHQVYGFCLYTNNTRDTFYAFLNDKSGRIEQWELLPFGRDSIKGELTRTLEVRSQPEGMVANTRSGTLYVGEENRGIWAFDLEAKAEVSPTFIAMSGRENPAIRFDIEGLAIYETPVEQYLIASSQGNNSYAVFGTTEGYPYLGSFRIGSGESIDGTEDTDGIDVVSTNLGAPFSSGLFVAQDGLNQTVEGRHTTQNFKYLPWEEVQKLFESASTPHDL